MRDALRTALTVNLAATAGLFLCVLLPCWLLGAPFKFVALFALGDFAVGLLGSAVFSAFPGLVITNAAMARQATGRNGHEKWLLSNVRKLSAAAKIQPPACYIYSGDEINALAMGSEGNHAIAITALALEALDNDSARGLLAIQIGRIASGTAGSCSAAAGAMMARTLYTAGPAKAPKNILDVLWMLNPLRIALAGAATVVAATGYESEKQADAFAVKVAGPETVWEALAMLATVEGDTDAATPKAFALCGTRTVGYGHRSYRERAHDIFSDEDAPMFVEALADIPEDPDKPEAENPA